MYRREEMTKKLITLSTHSAALHYLKATGFSCVGGVSLLGIGAEPAVSLEILKPFKL